MFASSCLTYSSVRSYKTAVKVRRCVLDLGLDPRLVTRVCSIFLENHLSSRPSPLTTDDRRVPIPNKLSLSNTGMVRLVIRDKVDKTHGPY